MIPIYKPSIGTTEKRYIRECLKSGWVSRGEYVDNFEEDFAGFSGAQYATSTSSGTTALHLALLSLGVGKDDEVIVPVLSFVATANAVTYCGAKPVFVDCCDDGTMDITKIKITKKTKAIIVVHLYGVQCKIPKTKIPVVEDCAESLYSKLEGTIACYSFYGNKEITTGEGGMCTTNDKRLFDKMRLLKNHGMTKSYHHPIIGYNYRMTNLQAALGLAQLENHNIFRWKKENHFLLYDNLLLDDIDVFNSSWLYCILSENRDELIQHLAKAGIEAKPFFTPMNKLPPYKTKKKFPMAEGLSKLGVCLPSYPDLKEKEVRYICNEINIFESKR